MEKGTLYWITGLSGAGKTTIGNRLYYELRKNVTSLVILDGDILKNLVSESLGYSREDRKKRANCYSNLCKMLTDQGINVIICTIAMFDSVREWNRDNIERYVEIYLKVKKEILIQRDRKNLYTKQKKGTITQVAGIDVEVEFPKHPDIIIENNGEKPIAEYIKEILSYPVKNNNPSNRDISYWNVYYKRKLDDIQNPSNFAKAMLPYMEKGKSLLDLGCGNGRDSIFFAQNEIWVTGIDASKEAIGQLENLNLEYGNFVCDDFVTSQALYQIQYDYFYSRWTIHAISKHQESELLPNVFEALKPGGMFFIEARSVNDELYGKGTPVAENSFLYDNHFRRFLEKDQFCQELEACGFHICSAIEGKDFSRTESSNPTLLRIIASKME